MMGRPVIAIAAYQLPAQWDMWDATATLIHQGYVNGVANAGGRVVVLAVDTIDDDVLDRVDGLLLPGGPDVGPRWHGQPAHPFAEPSQHRRDEAEMLLLEGALRRGLPVLGVCRGMQLMGLLAGGRLIQHLPDEVGHDGHSPADGSIATHEIALAPGSHLSRIYGARTTVNSHHHQAQGTPGDLRVTAWTGDGVIEGLEDPARDFVVGVQWHPELSGDPVFGAFVEACRRGVEERSSRVATRGELDHA